MNAFAWWAGQPKDVVFFVGCIIGFMGGSCCAVWLMSMFDVATRPKPTRRRDG